MPRVPLAVVACVVAGLGAACSLFVDANGLSGESADAGAPATADAGVANDSGGPPPTPADAGDAGARDPSLVGEWHFDDIGGTLSPDTSGYGRPALLKGAAQIVAGGVRGGALALAGGSDVAVVSALDGAAFPTTGTLSLWVRYTFNPGDGQSRAIFDDWNGTRSHLFLRRPDGATNAKMMQVALQDSTTYVAVGGFALEPSTWAHVVVTWDAVTRQLVLFVAGREIAVTPYARPFSPDGERFVLGGNWVGQIDELRLWTRVLSDIEVAGLD